jgi:small multidrug resistance pump
VSSPYALLGAAILCEVVATLALRATSGFTRVVPSVAVVVGYVACFALLGLALKAGLNLNVGYAIWSGVGTAVIAVVSTFLFRERLTALGVLGIALVVAGVVLLHLGSDTGDGAGVSPPG